MTPAKPTVEELMRPRYKVIADYPEMERHNIRIGDIITRSESAMYADKTQDGTPVVAIDHEIFPAVFRRLSWWEDRSPEDMPRYLRSSETYPDPHFIKVNKNYATFFEGEYYSKDTFKPYWECHYNLYFPATEQQFNEFTDNTQNP